MGTICSEALILLGFLLCPGHNVRTSQVQRQRSHVICDTNAVDRFFNRSLMTVPWMRRIDLRLSVSNKEIEFNDIRL